MERLKIEDVLEKEGIYVATICGVSMYPMLRNRRDTVVIKPYEGRLKKFDIPLYKVEDKYILHRIIKVLPDSYIIRGDNTEVKERGITDEKIARINELYKKSKAEGLNDAELREQALLRREYIESFKRNLRSQLDNIDIKEADGSITNLGEKYGNKIKKGN